MTSLLKVEILKLRTTRIGWLLLAVAQLIVIAGVSGLVLSDADLAKTDTASKAVAHVGLVSLCALILGIFAIAGEYRHQTITDTYLSMPRRGWVLAAKVVAYTSAGVVMGLISSVTVLVTAKIWWAAKGVPLDLTNADLWRTLVGGVAWNAGFAAIGVALGALVRNLAAAIAAALAWIALVEGIVGQLVGDGLRRWLPFSAGQALGRAAVGGAGHLPQGGAAVVLAGYAGLISLVAVSITLRRDVT
jgi:ABC-2 type transport system permease protein